ncbi:OppA family ABC transporter substrate-binding lipoprotein [[Mycoplasma] anseris]|uniref:Lipoprotein n=1 Tax=[Mycoplasma] anseris TaxID=92400 RepID=A0A2Z4ND79_9BACT|nr:hypothetical protein [[Mycoplasma] anseris]AWX69509.1 hypothetical protein DP065_01955 [[Mycoplasma] anseris]
MKKNLKGMWIFGGLSLLLGIIPISCNLAKKNDYNALHDNYVTWINKPNMAKDFSYAYSNNYDDNLRDINLLTGSKVFRIASQKSPVMDFRDNIVLQPSELWYKMEYAREVLIESWSNEINKYSVHLYNNDRIKKVNLNETLEEDKQPNEFYPNKDKGNGFNNPYIFVPSSLENSINHSNFFNSLKFARSITLNFDSPEWNVINNWITYEGSKTKYKVKAVDFRLGLLKTALQNKAFRDEFYDRFHMNKAKAIEKEIYTEDNPYLNGPSLQKLFQNYQIKYDDLLNPQTLKWTKDSSIIRFELNSDLQQRDLTGFFDTMFIYSNYMDAIPYVYLTEKYNTNDLFSDDIFSQWFFNYGKTYKDRLYSSYYLIHSDDNNQTKLWRNTQYKTITGTWNTTKHLNEIIFRYNQIPLNQDTFNIQMLSAFKQNIISDINVSNLSIIEREEILKQSNQFKLNYFKLYEKYKPHNNLILNIIPKQSKSYYFNNNFAKLYYQTNINDLQNNNIDLNNIFSNKAMIFRSLINNVINNYTLAKSINFEPWLSQAPLDLKFVSNNLNNTNYQYLREAHLNLNRQKVLSTNEDNKLISINKTNMVDNKLIYENLDSITNLKAKLKSADFDYVKSTLKNMINEYYVLNSNSKNIEWDIPILAFELNKKQQQIIQELPNIFKDIDKRLQPRIMLINNYDLYKEYFLSSKSIYIENKFNLLESNTTSYIFELLKAKNHFLLLYLLYIYNHQQEAFNYLNKLSKSLFNKLKSNPKYNLIFNLENWELKNINSNVFQWNDELENVIYQYLQELIKTNFSTEDIVWLINEINNLLSFNIDFNNSVSIVNYNKVALQKYFIKPFAYDGLNYLQDIVIGE